jgi:hypothetical protein
MKKGNAGKQRLNDSLNVCLTDLGNRASSVTHSAGIEIDRLDGDFVALAVPECMVTAGIVVRVAADAKSQHFCIVDAPDCILCVTLSVGEGKLLTTFAVGDRRIHKEREVTSNEVSVRVYFPRNVKVGERNGASPCDKIGTLGNRFRIKCDRPGGCLNLTP